VATAISYGTARDSSARASPEPRILLTATAARPPGRSQPAGSQPVGRQRPLSRLARAPSVWARASWPRGSQARTPTMSPRCSPPATGTRC
jgi:hypothetical protein